MDSWKILRIKMANEVQKFPLRNIRVEMQKAFSVMIIEVANYNDAKHFRFKISVQDFGLAELSSGPSGLSGASV